MKQSLVIVFLSFLLSPLVLFAEEEKATFAGGCFWCMEPPFEKLPGVKTVVSGYMGGQVKDPTYKQVSAGSTGHKEVVQVTFENTKINYKDLLEVFWRNVDPTDAKGQFVDRGEQYTTAIFYHNDHQKRLAQQSKQVMDESKRFKKKIVTPIIEASPFYPAEQYHQDYYKNSILKYKFYRARSGRDDYIKKTWGDEKEYVPKLKKKNDKSKGDKMSQYSKPSDEKIKEKLNSMQFKVTQKDGTEPPFKNEFWDNKQEGIYVDVVSGEPLFSSTHKYKSGTGWPSFFQPIDADFIVKKEDRKWFSVRTEVRSKVGDSHLGHVFEDGPKPTGLRYCINSAALRFIPKDKLEEQGYGQYLSLFPADQSATK